MGTWSHEPFGNDTACDWGYGLAEATDLSTVESALDAVAEVGEEYLESDVAIEAVAAVEVLAKLLGKGTQTDSYTEQLDQWVIQHPVKPSPALLAKARAALERIQATDSELLELWEDSEDADAWKASLRTLAAAVSA